MGKRSILWSISPVRDKALYYTNILCKTGGVAIYFPQKRSIKNLFKSKDLDTIIKIIELFKIIYYKRMDIGKNKIICLIENLSDILKDNSEIKDNNSTICFYHNLKKIFLKDLMIKITNKKIIKKTILKKCVKKTNEMICEKENEDEKDDEKEIDIAKSQIEDVQRVLDKNNKSNLSKYSENSKHQIAKLEAKIKDLEKQLEQKNSEKNIINITFYDEEDKKEYPLKVTNNEIDFEELKVFLYKKYPNLEKKDIKKFAINGNEIDTLSETDCDEFTKISFWPKK